jgi:phage shock protein PspC (stress-responsive transcriptional regulator)
MNEQSTTDPQTGLDKIFTALRGTGIQRRTDDKWIGGVCSGLADRLGVDPVIVRAALVLLSILGGVGVTVYLVAWALLPNDKNEIAAERAVRDGDGGSVVLLVIATIALLGGSWWGGGSGWNFPWGLAVAGLLIWWVVNQSRNRPDADQRVTSHQPGPVYTPGSSPTAYVPGQSPTAYAPGQGPTMYVPTPPGSGSSLGPTRPAPTPPRPTAPKRLRRRSGGPLMALVAIGLALLTFGAVNWLGNENSWTGNHVVIALAASLAAVALLLVGLGIAGLRAGFVGFLAIVLALSATAAAVVPTGIHFNGRFGDSTWRPTAVTSDLNYELSAGTGVLDLGKLPLDGLHEAKIPAYIGLGELKVLVPEGLNVKVVGHVGLGNIVAPGDENDGQGGSDVSRTISVGDPAGPVEVVVDAGLGVGQLTVVKE